MILRFPNHDALKLAISSGLVPETIWLKKAESVLEEDGSVLVKSEEKLPRSSASDLKKLGVKSQRSFPKQSLKLACWLQAFPLVRTQGVQQDWSGQHLEDQNGADHLSEKTTVLFHLPGEKNLTDLVSEMLRLGNDRQSFRYLETAGKQPFGNAESNSIADASSFLRVIGPPYYSMLRALDDGRNSSLNLSSRSDPDPDSYPDSYPITAFVETSPRVWVQHGFKHPLAAQVKPPAGKLLFIKPGHSWLFIKEAPFRDIYQSIEFGMPDVSTQWTDVPLENKIDVPLRLKRGSSTDPAEMWVLRKNGLAQIERIVNESDNPLVKRLAFAVCQSKDSGGEPCVIVRVRPSRKAPPFLGLEGLSLRSYLNIPNLFLPVGTQTNPPLRRDAITQLLAADDQQVVWLEPESLDDSNRQFQGTSFSPQSVPDSAFRPLSDWVEYVLDHEHKSLESWVASYQFDFEPFVCGDDQKNKPKKKGPSNVKLKGSKKNSNADFDQSKVSKPQKAQEDPEKYEVELAIPVAIETRKPDELQVELNELESQFLKLDSALDHGDRIPLWREMGSLNAKLDHRSDSTVCWSNAVWNAEESEERSTDYTNWLHSELSTSKFKVFENFSASDLNQYCDDKSTRPLDSSLVVAYLVWASDQETMPIGLGERLNDVAQFMERQEQFLPIRTAWLAWKSLYKLSGNDTLMLARARDRVLHRLFEQGLPAEYDMPSFMRARGIGQSERFRLILNHVKELQLLATDWIEEPVVGDAKTKTYATMMFAFALAKLGEVSGAKTMVVDSIESLAADDPIHNWLGNAYEYRVTQALNGQSSQNQLTPELLKRLDEMEKMSRYKVDRLRGLSRILEPHERINAFTRWHRRHADELDKQLSKLSDETDREKLRDTMTSLLKEHQSGHKNYGRVLMTAMELAPRLGEDFANHLFDEVVTWLGDKKAPTMEKAILLQKSLYVAAHFGRIDVVQSYVSLFEKSLSGIVSEYLALQSNHNSVNKEKVDAIESLFTESFRGLRKLGMREEIGRLYSGIEALIEKHEPAGKKGRQAKNTKKDIDTTRPLRLLLCVAAGRYYFGQEEKASAITKQVRKILLTKKDLPSVEQKDVACAYVNCVSHAPVDYAISMIKELYQRKKTTRALDNIKDNMTTSSHFSISQLALIESTVLALVSDEFSLNDESRRWLDEDEFLVRNRIHEDVRTAMK